MVEAADGHYVAGVHEIKHANVDYGEYVAKAPGMHFDQYGLVYMTFNWVGSKGDTWGQTKEYAPRLAVGAFDANTKAMKFYKHQADYFGEGLGVTYIDRGATEANFYVGGATDGCTKN